MNTRSSVWVFTPPRESLSGSPRRRSAWMIAALLSALPACSSESQAAATSSGAGGAGGAPTPPQPGLRAEYFDGYMDPVLERIEPTLDHDWTDGAPGDGVGKDRFSARWTGARVPLASGTYTLAL